MNTRDLGNTLPTLFAELVDGASKSEAYMLNRGDAGLLRSLDRLSLENLRNPREVSESELNSVVGSIAHLAYHVGAIRQIDLSARGPSAED